MTTEVDPNTAILQGRLFDQAVQGLQQGIVIPRDRGMPAAIEETKRVLSSRTTAPSVLYQPAFRVGDLAVIADILRRSGSTVSVRRDHARRRVGRAAAPCGWGDRP
jgi:hypothetical protein